MGPESDLPPEVAEFLALLNEAGDDFTTDSTHSGTGWTIRDADAYAAMEFRSGPAAGQETTPEELGMGPACMDVGALWDNPEFRRQLDADLVDIWGRPAHPEARDFFSKYHTTHDHDH